MTKLTITSLFILFASLTAIGQTRPATKPKVIPITIPSGSAEKQVEGDLTAGMVIPLGWAERSSVACFPGTRFEMFNGNHVLYRVDMPARSRMTITLTPKDGKLINLYALRQGSAERTSPPDISSAISCEAKYPIYANLPTGRTVSNKDDGTRKIEFVSIGTGYSILIGAAGAKNSTEGAYTLNVKVEGR